MSAQRRRQKARDRRAYVHHYTVALGLVPCDGSCPSGGCQPEVLYDALMDVYLVGGRRFTAEVLYRDGRTWLHDRARWVPHGELLSAPA